MPSELGAGALSRRGNQGRIPISFRAKVYEDLMKAGVIDPTKVTRAE